MHTVTVPLAEDPQHDPREKWFDYELPIFLPHEVLGYMFDMVGVEVPQVALQQYWSEAHQAGIPWAVGSESDDLRVPVKFFADDAQVNDMGDKIFTFVLSCPLFRPKSARNSKWPVALINMNKSLGWPTLRPILSVLVNSLNTAFDTATPVKGLKFQVTELGMDWKAMREIFQLGTHWNSQMMCHMCHMKNTDYYTLPYNLQWRTAVNFVAEVLRPANVTPLVLLRRFDISCIKWCSLHNVNLGILWTINGGSLVYLVEKNVYGDLNACGWDSCFKSAYKDFKEWQSRVGVHCSQRRFSSRNVFKQMHGAYLTAKGYNSRCITAYLADKSKAIFDACHEPVPPELLLQTHCLCHILTLALLDFVPEEACEVMGMAYCINGKSLAPKVINRPVLSMH